MKKIISAIIIICIIIIGFIAYKSMTKPTVKANATTLMHNSSSSNTQKTDTSNGDNTSSNTSTCANTGNNSNTNTTNNNTQSQSTTTSNSSNVGNGQNNESQGITTSSSTSTTNSNKPATNTQKLIPSRIEYLNLADPFGYPISLLATPNINSPIIPDTVISGVVKVKILGLVPDQTYFYVGYNGKKGFISSSNILAFATNYQNNLNTSNISKPNPTGTISYTISIPNNVVINAYKTPEMNTAPILQLENTDRGTCTLLLCKHVNNSAEIFYKNQTLYINNNYLIDYYVPQIQINDFIN